ncbi:DUF4864 domain-containing protein [Tropicibacter sp. Alg240-R139]|uniref:DUF4864 domain-containing protein n=1 Tax=Tropicibacter sp. Alg240-R139 TaxID=2305991 RepID=UPI0013DE9949|nr:DUF4864 domain-containing protein [Tropicibacter sp. Alg240-R139]
MRQFVSAVALTLALASPLPAQEVEIESQIRSQILAFKADDFVTAFGFASPTIQNLFRTPENFGVMVRRGYPMVWRPGEVRFLELREIAGYQWQKVMITDGDGSVHILDYQMVNEEGVWKINGVQILDAGGETA